MAYLVVGLYLLILGVFGYPLLRDREYRELTVFSVLMLISFYYVLAVMLDWPLINPALPVMKIGKIISGFFK
ncbi:MULTISPECIES: hypothetical protein [Carboxydothermus]|uniref:Uncharacterized protein n=1 Tax=Carboxydothermus ferrireducens DSM 11255 TaxID=1119529 RepID=A0ABX2R7W8_9THEO|nr:MULTISPECIES: hypothetical protein [Carboxydothermus]NYE57271.1 hypothetical protein [Carboxydothermus ferrireducens DSM 11255]